MLIVPQKRSFQDDILLMWFTYFRNKIKWPVLSRRSCLYSTEVNVSAVVMMNVLTWPSSKDGCIHTEISRLKFLILVPDFQIS